MTYRSVLDSIARPQRKGRKTKLRIATTCYSVNAASQLYDFFKISFAEMTKREECKPGASFYPNRFNKDEFIAPQFPKSGDLIKILLPHLQTTGKSYVWHEITKVEERLDGKKEIFFITIVPAMNSENETPESGLLPGRELTVTLFVIRDENTLVLEVHTLDEELNFHFSGFRTSLQMIMMSLLVAGGFYEYRWTKMMKTILKNGIGQMKNYN